MKIYDDNSNCIEVNLLGLNSVVESSFGGLILSPRIAIDNNGKAKIISMNIMSNVKEENDQDGKI